MPLIFRTNIIRHLELDFEPTDNNLTGYSNSFTVGDGKLDELDLKYNLLSNIFYIFRI